MRQKYVLFCRCSVFSFAKEMRIKVDITSMRINILNLLRVKFSRLFILTQISRVVGGTVFEDQQKRSPLNFHFKSNFENTYLIFSPFFKLTLFRCNAFETKMRPYRLFQNTVLCCESWLRFQCCPDALAPDACNLQGPLLNRA